MRNKGCFARLQHVLQHTCDTPVQLCISVGYEGDQLESWKFYYICKKGHCIHSWPQIECRCYTNHGISGPM